MAYPPPHGSYGSGPYGAPYGAPTGPYGAPNPSPYGGGGSSLTPYPQGGMSPFSALTPSNFSPDMDPTVVAAFRAADVDGSGFVDDRELQRLLSNYNQCFSIRTVHLVMYLFTGSHVRRIGPKEFSSVYYCLRNWREIFERFDRDRSGKIDVRELQEALMSLGFSVSPMVVDLLVSKFDKTGGYERAIEYDNFIECCLTVKGLTEKFRERDMMNNSTATFTYDSFMLTVLPFLVV